MASNITIPINTDSLIEFKPFKGEFLKLNEEQRTAIIAGLAEKLTNAALLFDELTEKSPDYKQIVIDKKLTGILNGWLLY